MIHWMTKPRRPARLRWAISLPLVVALGAGMAARALPSPVLVNESPSLPEGLYWRAYGADTVVGSVVAVAQPAQARSYLTGLGLPGEMLLIKRVAATGGDVVCALDGAVETPIGRYRVRDRDSRGRALPVWGGCRLLGSDELFLVGDTATSFDSRYFGPVRRADIVGVYREGPTW